MIKKDSYIFFFIFVIIINNFSFGYDTSIISDGLDKTIKLNSALIDSSSIEIFSSDSFRIINWNFDKEKKSILLSDLIDSGSVLKITYNNNYLKFPKKVNLYNKKYISFLDTISVQNNFSILSIKKEEQVDISGFKSFSVSFDNNGAVFLEQGLDISVGGKLKKETQIYAHLTDQSSSLENTTKEISDFDFIYLQLLNPHFSATVGDQYIYRLANGFYNDKKKIKGISASIKNKKLNLGLFGSISGGKFTVENIKCDNGLQGPYFLKGNGENGYIQPIAGTIKVKLNGKELIENTDYVIDYNYGSITVKNKILLFDYDILTLEYEYKLFDYQQFLYGLNTSFNTNDSNFNLNGSVWINTDNKNNPIDRVFTENEKNTLKKTGDTLPLLSSEEEVDPKDVPSYSQIYPLYKKVLNNNKPYFVYTQYDLSNPENRNGFYQVWFSYAGEGKGDYIQDTIVLMQNIFQIYLYKGPNSGQYTPYCKISTPERKISGEIGIDYNKENIKINLFTAGENYDKNTFSSANDNSNNSSAVKTNLETGDKENSKIWISGSYNFKSRNFSKEIFSKFNLYQIWNDTNQYLNSSNHYYYLSTGLNLFRFLHSELLFGQIISNEKIKSSIISGKSKIDIYKSNLNFNGYYSDHQIKSDFSSKHSADLSYTIPIRNISYSLTLSEDWEKKHFSDNKGNISFKADISYLKFPFNESFSVKSFRKGVTLLDSKDTGYNYVWEQSFNTKPTSFWNMSGNSFYYKNVNKNKSEDNTIIINFENIIDVKKFSLNQKYSTNIEKSSSYIQIPVYAGKGLGNYAYDSLLQEFIPHIPGDWFMQENKLSNNISDLRVKRTEFTLQWKLDPLKKRQGILSDIYWEGNLILEEQIDSKENKFSSWFPGYYSMRNYFDSSFAKDKIENSNLSYRQDITIKPKNRNVSLSSFIMPSLKKLRTSFDYSLLSGVNLLINVNKFSFSNNLLFKNVMHDDKSNYQDLKFKDLSDENMQKILLFRFLNFYLKENIGITKQSQNLNRDIKIFDNGKFYYQLSPGFENNYNKFGTSDLSYTFSNVPFIENKDYRIAQGYKSGQSHIISFNANIKVTKNIYCNGIYRFEYNIQNSTEKIEEKNQILSLEAKIVF